MSKIKEKYTQIANVILEATMKTRFTSAQRRIIDCIWRYTYGFHRKDHEFAVSFIAKAIHMDERKVKEELKTLINNKVLLVTRLPTNKLSRKIGFNKRTEQWMIQERSVVEVANQPPQVELWGDEMTPSRGDDLTPSGGVVLTPQEKKGLKKVFKESSTSIYEQVISYLNDKTGKKYSHKSQANKSLINGRLNEGRTAEDFIYVIDIKVAHWLNDEKMREYLRPSTLFNATNFENYMNQTMENPHKKHGKNQDELNILKDFYEEGKAGEENGNGTVSGRNQNSLPPL